MQVSASGGGWMELLAAAAALPLRRMEVDIVIDICFGALSDELLNVRIY